MARVHRTVLDLDPHEAFLRLHDLPDLLGEQVGLTIHSWPRGGCAEGATFTVEHDGDEVTYAFTVVDAPHLVLFQGNGGDWAVGHCLVIAPAVGGGSELVWTTTADADDARHDLLGGVVLRQLTIATGASRLAA